MRDHWSWWANGILENATIAVPLKYLSNLWRSLEMPLVNFKIDLELKWTKYCVLSTSDADNATAILIISFSLSKTQNYIFLLL